MTTRSFNPGWPLTVAVSLAFIVLVSLGTWQARKVGPKTALLAQIEAGLKAEPMLLPVHLDDPSTLAYHRVSFTGTVLDRDPIKVFATSLGGKSGYHIYLPVQKQHGMAVLVNFGWVPAHIEGMPSFPVGETIEVTGVLLTSAVPGSMTPPNDARANQWFTADVFEMAEAFGLRTKEFYHFRVAADAGVLAGELPVGGQVRVDIPNDHFQYALTWYGLALGLIGVYVAFGLKRGRENAQNKHSRRQ
ncbi:SURF1 family protein [Kordiimonas sp.]|uniref:SURF1 family protein n=1 Tax=Kordiimonas sp. TaxID=1970157 RepID=UPI003A90601B